MPCEILIVATAKLGLTEKGDPWIIKDTPVIWGSKEGPPNWVKLRITDATANQVQEFLTEWYKDFDYSIITQNAQGYRIKITTDAAGVSLSGIGREVEQKVKNHLVSQYGAKIVSYDDYEVVLDVPISVNLQKAKASLSDIGRRRLLARRYYFSGADIDAALVNGGLIELTRAQVLSRIKDKLGE